MLNWVTTMLTNTDLAQARIDVASYIIGYYSQIRPHSFNNYLTPVEKEKQFFIENLLDTV